jgi:hypothetical protein
MVGISLPETIPTVRNLSKSPRIRQSFHPIPTRCLPRVRRGYPAAFRGIFTCETKEMAEFHGPNSVPKDTKPKGFPP